MQTLENTEVWRIKSTKSSIFTLFHDVTCKVNSKQEMEEGCNNYSTWLYSLNERTEYVFYDVGFVLISKCSFTAS